MPNDCFFQLRLAGDRFSDHSIPFDALRGIAQFKALVVEASRLEYFKRERSRKRVPRGLSQSIELKLTSIERGSVQVRIGLELSGTIPLIADQESYFTRGRDHLIRTIQKAGNGENMGEWEVSEKMSNGFDSIAKMLEDDEAIHVICPDGLISEANGTPNSAVFTRETAARLRSTKSTDKVVSKDIEICGYIPEFNQENNTFRLQSRDGKNFKTSVSSELLGIALEIFNGYRRGLEAQFRGVGTIESDGTIIDIEKINHLLVINNPSNINHQFERIRKLRDGWLDGEGKAPSCDGVDWIESILRRYIPINFPPIYLFPTDTGGILIEWSVASSEASIEVNLESRTGIWHELDVQSDEDFERTLHLDRAKDWQQLIQHVDSLRRVR